MRRIDLRQRILSRSFLDQHRMLSRCVLAEESADDGARRIDERFFIAGESECLEQRHVREAQVFGAEKGDLNSRLSLARIRIARFRSVSGNIRGGD